MLDLNEIQGLVFRAYGDLRRSAYLLLTVTDRTQAAQTLKGLIDGVQTAGHKSRHRPHARGDGSMRAPAHLRDYPGLRINIALTHEGLGALGYPNQTLDDFPAAFSFGMAEPPQRNRVLGDTGKSDPRHWTFRDRQGHVLLLVYGRSQEDSEDEHEEFTTQLEAFRKSGLAGFAEVHLLKGYLKRDKKEHFGFRDGLSQPYIEGTDLSGIAENAIGPESIIKPGEFILGYENEFGCLPHSPRVPVASDVGDHLKPSVAVPSKRRALAIPEEDSRDFGRNGTYLVLRKLEQHVEAFHAYASDKANGDPEEAKRVEAKMVGRWHDGTPITLASHAPNPELSGENRFAYAEHDIHGVGCPVGAHIRRGFPRDAKVDQEKGMTREEALRLTRQHRIIRRGRLYKEEDEQGVLFMCLNTNIERQFEFVQHTWCNAEGFSGLRDEKDPLVGDQPEGGGRFTIPQPLLRKRLADIPRFVTMRGGGYFFLPSISALRYLAALSET